MTFRKAIELAGQKAGLKQRDAVPPQEIAALLDQEMQMNPGMTEEEFIKSLAEVLANPPRIKSISRN